MLKAADEYTVPIHRISRGSGIGITRLRDDDEEIRFYTELEAAHGIEVCLSSPPPRPITHRHASGGAPDRLTGTGRWQGGPEASLVDTVIQ